MLNRREMLAGAVGLAGTALLPGKVRPSTTSYSAPFWQFSDVSDYDYEYEVESGRTTRWWLKIENGGPKVEVTQDQYMDWLIWRIFESPNPEGDQFFTHLHYTRQFPSLFPARAQPEVAS